ncbi:MAG: SagB/ThcOx family dehydrogenase [Erysipelotrichaceae bacterium]|nr:SagB/ThcOx family dehydrogenase [Erysipelotrichaceae bacterium]
MIKELIQQGRDFLRPVREENLDFESDQMLKKPQPPLVKEPMRDVSIALPMDFENLDIDNDFLHIINSRKSHRVYTQQKVSLLELSYLLWCSQGVKGIRGKSYATLRTVPCGGARHEFECYMAIQNIEGLKDGLYHYLPMNHCIEPLSENCTKDLITESLQQQAWASKANVVFYYSFVAYRAEWRYGILAHRMIMADAGHITENLYLASTSIGLGGCAIGSVDGRICDRMFELDSEEEYIIYAMSVGTVSEKDSDKEAGFYSFVEKEGL